MAERLYKLVGVGLTAGTWFSVVWALGSRDAIAQPIAQPVNQITPDGSLGTLVNGSQVESCLSAICTITGGTLNSAGSTLLHSFSQFSIGQPSKGALEGAALPESAFPSALFVDPGVSDIVVRVTGNSASLINGLIGTSAGSDANLFLVNPSGIQFGANARLDLGGAFVGSTASKILFDNGIELATGQTTPADSHLLTISAPIGLGFLADRPSGNITVQGTGNRLVFGSPSNPDEQFVNRVFQSGTPPPGLPPLPPISELAVRPQSAIALIGNGIDLDGGNLTATGGQIELGSVEAGMALLNADLAVDYSQISHFADISLTRRATLETSAINPGRIRLHGRDISILDSSAVLSEALPALSGGADTLSGIGGLIELQASRNVEISGFTATPSIPFNPPFHTYLSVDVAPGASAAGGLLNIRSRDLSIDSGGQIGANAYGSGDAGRLQITVDDTLAISGGSFLGPSGLFAITGRQGNNSSGQINIDAGHLLMTGGAQVLTSSLNEGAAGNIFIDADRVSLIGIGQIDVPLPDGSVQTVGGSTLIQSGMGESSSGQSGDLVIEANQLLVAGGAEIATTTFGQGQAGSINISAKDIEVSGFSVAEGPSLIATTVAAGATGNGGSLNITSDRLRVLGGGQIRTGTLGSGSSGDLLVNSGSILVSGQTAQGRSGLLADAVGGVGAGGNLIIEANRVDITDGATLNVSNFPSQPNSPVPPGQGAAGDLRVTADRINLSGQSVLSAGTAAGDLGNIALTTRLLTLRDNSQITTNAIRSSAGGNIEINAENGFVLAVPNENSDITANAVFGDGGRVNIRAQQVLGLQVSPELTPLSDITASSEFGVAGEIRLATLNTDLRSEPTDLPQSTEVPELAQGCGVVGGNSVSRFVQSGRGGIGTNPYDVLDSRNSLPDISVPDSLRLPEGANERTTQEFDEQEFDEQNTSAENAPIVEAQDWTMNEQGEVTLMAARPKTEGSRCLSWQP